MSQSFFIEWRSFSSVCPDESRGGHPMALRCFVDRSSWIQNPYLTVFSLSTTYDVLICCHIFLLAFDTAFCLAEIPEPNMRGRCAR